MKFCNIIWDFDGTLFNTDGAIARAFLIAIQNDHNIEIESTRISQLVKIDTKHCAEVIAREHGLVSGELLALARSIYDSMHDVEQRPIGYAREICELVVSNGGSNYLVTNRDRKSLEKMLLTYNFKSYFRDIIASDEGFPIKPSPDSFEHMLGKYDLDSKSTCAIGDRDLDILAANRAGISSIYFCPNGGSNNKATINIASLGEIRKHV